MISGIPDRLRAGMLARYRQPHGHAVHRAAAITPVLMAGQRLLAVPAHGVGNRADLPLPFWLLVSASAAALVISFVALGSLWRTPRLHADDGRSLSSPVRWFLDSSAVRTACLGLALALTAWTLFALVLGADTPNNPTAYVVFVWLWIGLAFASIVLGPVWSVLNPLRVAHRLVCRVARIDPSRGLVRYRLGYWPAAAGLFAFTWLELIAPDRTTQAVLGSAIALFLVGSLMAGLLFGSTWFREGDPFEVMSRLYGSLSPVGRRSDGSWVLRTPLHGVDLVPPRRGLLATTSVLLGGTAYDGFSGLTTWSTYTQTAAHPAVMQTLGLLGACAFIAGTLWLAAAASARVAGAATRGSAMAFAPSLLPIAAGYVVAHYWSLWVVGGQLTLALLADPLGTGANWLGTRHLQPDTTLIAPTLVACLQATAIVVGHLLGIVHSHERALRLYGGARALRAQVPMLVVMVAYTCGGLLLLFAA